MSDQIVYLSKQIKFRDVTNYLEEISNCKKNAKKAEYSKKFFTSLHSYRDDFVKKHGKGEKVNSSTFPLMRLLLADEETERTYGIKTITLSKVFIKALTISAQSKDAQTLNHCTKDEFAIKVYEIMLPRTVANESSLTVFEVDQFLNEISSNQKQSFIEDKLRSLIQKLKALDVKWLVKMILKKMYLCYSKKSIFYHYNSRAYGVYIKFDNLSKVCDVCDNNDWTDDDLLEETRARAFEVEVFQPLSPMLCGKIPNISEIIQKELFLDMKYDGERFQLHFKDGEYRYFSRKGHDYTDTYGKLPTEGNLTQFLHNQFKKPVKSLILDGEMMKYHRFEKKFHSKGEHENDVKKLKPDGPFRPCFCAFDILYFNGMSQMHKPFAERRSLLDSLINNREGVILKCIPTSIRDMDHLLDCLNHALDRQEEGIVIKEATSVYKAGKRGLGWYKVKADYLNGVCSDFDFAVIGGFYKNRHTRDFLYKFMVGVVQTLDNGKYNVYSAGEVTNGLSFEETKAINELLKDHLEDFSKHDSTLPFSKGRVEFGKNKPDVYIPPDKAVILEVLATELYKSDDYKTSHTLRFPRIKDIRRDKPWYEACSLQEFNSFSSGTSHGDLIIKLNKRRVDLDDVTSPVKKKRGRSNKLIKQFNESIEEVIEPIDNILGGREYCVKSSRKGLPTVQEIQIMIKKRGGRSVITPNLNKTHAIIAGEITFEVRGFMKMDYNIVKVEWILSALSENTINVPKLTPSDMISISSQLKEIFSVNFDEFGDDYTKELTADEFKAILNNMDCEKLPEIEDHEKTEILDIIESDPFNIFRNFKGVFMGIDESFQLKASKMFFELRGGIVLDSSMNEEVLIFVDPAVKPVKSSENQKVLSWKWIMDCQKEKKILEFKEFFVNC